jgi:hypothetical protein
MVVGKQGRHFRARARSAGEEQNRALTRIKREEDHHVQALS